LNPLINHAIDCLKTAGFDDDIQLLQERYDPQHFGNALVIFRAGRLLIQVIRERDHEFVELAAPARPTQFYPFDDAETVMGWKSGEPAVDGQGPEALASVLGRLFQHRLQLEDAFSIKHERSTRVRLEAAAKKRGEAIVAELLKSGPR